MSQRSQWLSEARKQEKYKWRYPGNAIITKNSLPEVLIEGEMRKWQTPHTKLPTHKQRTPTEEPPWNAQQENSWGGGLNQFYSRETSPLILMQLQITNKCSVRIWVLYFIYVTSQWNTYQSSRHATLKQRRFNVDSTSLTLNQRSSDVVSTLCVCWVFSLKNNLKKIKCRLL